MYWKTLQKFSWTLCCYCWLSLLLWIPTNHNEYIERCRTHSQFLSKNSNLVISLPFICIEIIMLMLEEPLVQVIPVCVRCLARSSSSYWCKCKCCIWTWDSFKMKAEGQIFLMWSVEQCRMAAELNIQTCPLVSARVFHEF